MTQTTAEASTRSSPDFRIQVDATTGALWEITDPRSASPTTNWISGPANAPWQPTGSRWGLGYADLGSGSLHRAHWTAPQVSEEGGGSSSLATYRTGPLELDVRRRIADNGTSFTETYTFKNKGTSDLDLSSRENNTALGIYTPFNDHYTNTTDAMQSRTHAHIWANGGSNAWVRMENMGGIPERDLGLVLTKGSLAGYSVEARDTITSSNTRGVFILHPRVPTLRPGEETEVEWAFFWHGHTWDDFFEGCAALSDQFIRFDVSSYVLTPGEIGTVRLSGSRVNSETKVNGEAVLSNDDGYSYTLQAGSLGEKTLNITTLIDGTSHTSTIILNSVPSYASLITARTAFITQKQQIIQPSSPLHNAYVLYDNQMKGQVTFDTALDRNSGRERIGMGVLLARWLAKNPSDELLGSLLGYYEFVCTRLQNGTGYVFDGPGREVKRLYNWPWVMQLHLTIAALNVDLPPALADKSPMERFILTLESYYAEGGVTHYPIGLPVLEGLRALQRHGSNAQLQRALTLFTAHADKIAETGLNLPPSEVNYEQSIVAPSTTILLELYRFTHQPAYLTAALPQLSALLRFNGHQPDHRLHDVAIRHWDGYWFGKDRMWGDTFPHYWSTITALALHHYGKATEDAAALRRADGIIRGNLVLFTPGGEGSCAWIYPLSVNGRVGHYADPYANDQDWALAFWLEMQADDEYEG